MKNAVLTFLIGSILGVALGFSANHLIGGRYKVTSTGPQGIMTIRTDRWTGRSWMIRYYEDKGTRKYFWEEMQDTH